VASAGAGAMMPTKISSTDSSSSGSGLARRLRLQADGDGARGARGALSSRVSSLVSSLVLCGDLNSADGDAGEEFLLAPLAARGLQDAWHLFRDLPSHAPRAGRPTPTVARPLAADPPDSGFTFDPTRNPWAMGSRQVPMDPETERGENVCVCVPMGMLGPPATPGSGVRQQRREHVIQSESGVIPEPQPQPLSSAPPSILASHPQPSRRASRRQRPLACDGREGAAGSPSHRGLRPAVPAHRPPASREEYY
jgi:hypothetical protein